MPTDDELVGRMRIERAPNGTAGRLSFAYSPHVGANRTWSPANAERYRESGAVAVSIAAPHDLAFVRDLPGLLSLRVLMHPVEDDSAVFEAPQLQQLHLLDRCRRAFRADLLPDLVDVAIDRRPGLATFEDHPSLRLLTVHGCNAPDLLWLGTPPELLSLHLDGTRRPLDLSAVARLRRLRFLTIQAFRLEDLSPLTACVGLEQIVIEGTGAEDLDLTPLSALPGLRSLVLQRTARVRNLETLLELPRLEELNLWRSTTDATDSVQASVQDALRRNLERNLAELAGR